MALGLPGVRVGVWTSPSAVTGCTVVLPPEGTVGAIAVRGAAPGTREAAALSASGKVTACHAVVLAGGSAYGLAAADGVMRWLEEQGIGYPVRIGVVPIVGAAIVLDAGVAVPTERPDAAAGRAACEVATATDPDEGGVGAGTGCTVAKVGGLEAAWRGGQGIAVRREGDLVVGALVVNNAVGELVDGDGRWLARARIADDVDRFPRVDLLPPDSEEVSGGGGPSTNTVIGCIVTNARLDKRQTHRVADLGHDGIVLAVRPAHTEYDGDALFALATGEVETSLDLVVAMAIDAVADAARRGPLAATGGHGLPGLVDGHP